MPLGTEEIKEQIPHNYGSLVLMGKTSKRRKCLGPCPGDMLIQLCKLKHTMVPLRKWGSNSTHN